MVELLEEWKVKTAKLDELESWMIRAEPELNGVTDLEDPRWGVWKKVAEAHIRLQKELGEIEDKQTTALTRHLEAVGPLTLSLEGGSTRILSANPNTAGGKADLLPDDLLKVWRVAAVFKGTVVQGGEVKPLNFGDAEQIAQFKTKKGHKRR